MSEIKHAINGLLVHLGRTSVAPPAGGGLLTSVTTLTSPTQTTKG